MLAARHCAPSTPRTTSTPASRSIIAPLSETLGLTSDVPMTTRATPACDSARAHGPVRPQWAQGSSVT